jgi:hypothetical protein
MESDTNGLRQQTAKRGHRRRGRLVGIARESRFRRGSLARSYKKPAVRFARRSSAPMSETTVLRWKLDVPAVQER